VDYKDDPRSGIVDALSTMVTDHPGPDGRTATWLAFALAILPAGIAAALVADIDPGVVLVAGLIVFGVVFAMNSAVHSYLILAYADGDKVAMNVGFYYMANAGGRLAGTVLSGVLYQLQGLEACLWTSAAFVLAAAVLSRWLPGSTPPSPRAASQDLVPA
jgi:predicted MFS family arabinose efflux permease